MMGRGTITSTALRALLLLAIVPGARAQEIEPRAYSNIPVGVNFLIVGAASSSGGLVTDPGLPLENAHLKTDGIVLAYARGIAVAGRSAKFDVIVPYAWVHGTADYAGEPVQRRVDGFGDPRLRFSINLLGAPAMPVQKIATYHQDTIVGLSVQVAMPFGQYDGRRLVNIGNNRWALKTELGVSKALGDWTLEVAPAATFFAVNDDFFGGHRRSQEPVYSVQGSVVYGLRRGIWLALSGTYYTGGKTSVDGGPERDLQRNSMVMATLALPINRWNSIKFTASTGLVTRIGTDADTFGIGWQHRWGGGL